MRKLLLFLLKQFDTMTDKEIITANNELLAAIAEKLGIETEVINPSRSIGGGGIKRPKKQ